MATFVLVHGAWLGGWCWHRVAPRLRTAGHDVYTPTLTGLGERAHLATPDVNVETHVRDVVNVVEFEDLHDVVLVGHSYGGVVIRAVASRIPDRIAHLIYLDAFVPSDGRSVFDLFEDHESYDLLNWWREQISQDPTGWQSPPPEGDIGIEDEADRRWVTERFTPQPAATLTQAVSLEQPAATATQHSFIICTPIRPGSLIAAFGEQARGDPKWKYRETEAGHNAMITEPEALVDLLIDLI